MLLRATLETVDCTVTDDFFLFKLETALPQARSFQPVACPINSAPSPTKFNTGCPPPDLSALSFIKAGPPLDLSFWSFLTFLQHGIEEVERHLL